MDNRRLTASSYYLKSKEDAIRELNKEKPKKRTAGKKTGRKTERENYDVHTNENGTKCVWYRLSGEGDGSVSVDVIDRIIKAEFPRVPRKKIKFSVDDATLYFGDDLD